MSHKNGPMTRAEQRGALQGMELLDPKKMWIPKAWRHRLGTPPGAQVLSPGSPEDKENQLRSPPNLHSLPYPSLGLLLLQSLHVARLHRLNILIRGEKVLHMSYSGEIICLLEKLLLRMQAISGGRARELLVPAPRAPAGFSPKGSSPSSPSAKAHL